MFKWLTAVNKKSCFINCEWYKSYVSNYNRVLDENKQFEKDSEFLSCLKKINNGYENIIFIDKNKGINIFISQSIEFDYNGRISAICIFCYKISLTGKPQKIMSLYSPIIFNQESNIADHAHIQDFIGSEVNEGYGSIVMKQFLKIIKSLHIKKVTGFLSFVDLGRSPEHKQLLYHFYQKFGFQIVNDKLELILE